MTLAGRVLRPGILRVALLLLALPIIVLAVDAFARARRAGVRLARGAGRGLAHRPRPDRAGRGAPARPRWACCPAPRPGRRRCPRACPSTPCPRSARCWPSPPASSRPGSGAARSPGSAPRRRPRPPRRWSCWPCCSCCCGGRRPYALVLALPAAHAALLATAAPRRWQVAGLAFVAVLPLLALCAVVGRVLDRGPVFAAWYLLETAASGRPGGLGADRVLRRRRHHLGARRAGGLPRPQGAGGRGRRPRRPRSAGSAPPGRDDPDRLAGRARSGRARAGRGRRRPPAT